MSTTTTVEIGRCSAVVAAAVHSLGPRRPSPRATAYRPIILIFVCGARARARAAAVLPQVECTYTSSADRRSYRNLRGGSIACCNLLPLPPRVQRLQPRDFGISSLYMLVLIVRLLVAAAAAAAAAAAVTVPWVIVMIRRSSLFDCCNDKLKSKRTNEWNTNDA